MSVRAVVTWAVVDKDGDVVGAYTNRVSASRRADYLEASEGRIARQSPYTVVRCEGTWEVKDVVVRERSR